MKQKQSSKDLLVQWLSRSPKNEDKIIAIIHHAHRWSVTVIDTRNTNYKCMIQNTIHGEANIELHKKCGRNTVPFYESAPVSAPMGCRMQNSWEN